MVSNNSISPSSCLFFNQKYAKIQQFENFQQFEEDGITICFNILGRQAFSLPKCPFGGFFTYNANKTELFRFYANVETSLRKIGVDQIEITQPQSVYPSIPKPWMVELGFEISRIEIGHYLPLKGSLTSQIHQMEKRKLKRSLQFLIAEEDPANLLEISTFIAECRKHQGLEINVSHEKLQAQFLAFPDRYKLFTARKDSELMSAVIMNQPTDKIAYYFLPGTLPKFRKLSPMVGLIGSIFSHYQEAGFDYIDFGISSILEVPQSSLITFKEHMGGVRNERITYSKLLI